jgi:hypothetical protein
MSQVSDGAAAQSSSFSSALRACGAVALAGTCAYLFYFGGGRSLIGSRKFVEALSREFNRDDISNEAHFIPEPGVVLLTGAACARGMGSQIALKYHQLFSKKGRTSVSLVLCGHQSIQKLKAEINNDVQVTQSIRRSILSMLDAHSTLYLQIDLLHLDCGRILADKLRENDISRIDLVVQLPGV